MQLTLTLKMTAAELVETSVTVNNTSIQDQTTMLNLLMKWLMQLGPVHCSKAD